MSYERETVLYLRLAKSSKISDVFRIQIHKMILQLAKDRIL